MLETKYNTHVLYSLTNGIKINKFLERYEKILKFIELPVVLYQQKRVLNSRVKYEYFLGKTTKYNTNNSIVMIKENNGYLTIIKL